MENISHSLAGLAAGELIHRSLPSESDHDQQRLRRALLLLACWLASNFPDLDLILSPLLPKPLGYLLHHRGHTHTLLFILPQALLLWGLIAALWPAARRLLRTSAAARKGLALALLIGPALHIVMDYLNSYGVHPWYPFDARWFYGDMVFIVEPFFWIALGVPLAMSIERRWLRGLWLAALVGAPLWFTWQGFLTKGSLALLLGSAALLFATALFNQHRSRVALTLGVLLAVGFVGVQAYASHRAHRMVADSLLRQDPAARVLDVALSPFPSNSLCWTFVSLEEKTATNRYRLRRGQLSLAPRLLPVTACPAPLSLLGNVAGEDTVADAAIAYVSADYGDLNWLRTLKTGNCHFAAWLRFARMPLLEDTHATDLRFTRNGRDNFSSIDLRKFDDSACSPWVPNWG
ncbi:MAG: metal-dependent hydrolase, partial [Proteobacteria bacterium]|nr:metal-dependent hydrolase [Pseudomonadota bacterium]